MEQPIKRIAVFSSGGDAPGMNAAIRAVVRTATYNDLHIYGIYRGYEGMINGEIERLETSHVANIIHRGGTILKTARSEKFRTPEGRKLAYESLVAQDIDACIAIGGNGTFTGAQIFSQEYDIPFIGIPGTIDNDLYGTDFTIGFDTAVNTAVEAVDRIRDTADSHNRLFFIEVMGRHSGYIALYTGIGSGAGFVMLPERETTIQEVIQQLKAGAKRKKLFSLVIVAEGHPLGGAQAIADAINQEFDYYETKVAIIGHLQRGGSPTAQDRVLASQLGYSAVEGLLAGQRNVMVGQVNEDIVFTDFNDSIQQIKVFNPDLLRMAEILGL
ncbi:MAG: 6-phosphofructokinase [Saprospiraceae bacterium]|nr:6-phosphofructokinase [Saprospiraceae bacterium]